MSDSNISSRSSSTDYLSPQQTSIEDVPIEVKYSINIILNKVFISNENKEFEFPTSLSSIERKYIHKICKLNGLASVTKGKGSKKYVTVAKKDSLNSTLNKTLTISFPTQTKQITDNRLEAFEMSVKEKNELLPKIQKKDSNNHLYLFYANLKRICLNEPRILLKRYLKSTNSSIDYFKDEILNTLNGNHYFYIGCDNADAGISTIHLLMDYFCFMNEMCRIVLAEPNDLSAYVMARRLANDLNEQVGQTIGLETNAENKQDLNTIVTVCTNEILFKNLIAFDDLSLFNSITLIILNQMHVRDKYIDFLLVMLREKFKNIKFIMIGSTVTTNDIQKIFPNCPFVMVPKTAKKCQESYLEDILKMIGFKHSHLNENSSTTSNSSKCNQSAKVILLEQWCTEKQSFQIKNKASTLQSDNNYQNSPLLINQGESPSQERLTQLADFYLSDSFIEENLKSLYCLLQLIQFHNLNVDYQHSVTKITALMSASACGCVQVAENLLLLGASLFLKSCNNLTSLHWAKRFEQTETIELLQSFNNINKSDENLLLNELNTESNKDTSNDSQLVSLDESLLKEYYKNLKSLVDYELIHLMLSFMLKFPNQGSILIFLPNNEYINECYEIISKDNVLLNKNGIKIFKIYSEMNFSQTAQIIDSYKEQGCQIILTTCIAETLSNFTNSSTIIDSGFTEEVSFDSMTNLSVKKLIWTTKLSKMIKTKFFMSSLSNFSYYHLYSKSKFSSLQMQPTPQLLSNPTHEICTLAKLSSINTSITDTISKIPEAPTFLQLRNSINYLKAIDVLDVWEDMTELGVHMVLFPFIRHELAKMVLNSLVLRCLEPFLFIAAWLTLNTDIFLSADPKNQKKLIKIKKNYAGDTCSDHIMAYRVYKDWKKASFQTEEENVFCTTYLINQDAINKIDNLRNKLFDYLNRINFLNANKYESKVNDLNLNSDCTHCIKAILVSSLYPHLLRIDKKKQQFSSEKELKIKLSSESLNWTIFKNKKNKIECSEIKASKENESEDFDWLVYDELVQNSELHYIKRSTLVSSLTICLFAGPLRHPGLFKEPEDQLANFKLDNWINFNMKLEDFKLVMMLRQKWSSIMLSKIKFQHKIQNDEESINNFIDIFKNISSVKPDVVE